MNARKDERLHSDALNSLTRVVRILAAIGEKIVCFQPFAERQILRAICDGARSDRDTERKPKRSNGQMYFAVLPPFARPTPSSPPAAPAACW